MQVLGRRDNRTPRETHTLRQNIATHSAVLPRLRTLAEEVTTDGLPVLFVALLDLLGGRVAQDTDDVLLEGVVLLIATHHIRLPEHPRNDGKLSPD